MAEDKQKTISCPRCNYERAEIHNLIIAGTVRKIGETIICPKCQKKGGHTMKLLITLLLAALTLYAFIKRTYNYASVQDEVEAPIDYEETREYKENEIWFSGVGRY